MSLRCNVCTLADSWTAKCPVLCHLFRCFDPRFKENAPCHPAFVIRDINICRTATHKAVYNPGRAITAVNVIGYRFLTKPTTNHSAIFVDIKRYNS